MPISRERVNRGNELINRAHGKELICRGRELVSRSNDLVACSHYIKKYLSAEGFRVNRWLDLQVYIYTYKKHEAINLVPDMYRENLNLHVTVTYTPVKEADVLSEIEISFFYNYGAVTIEMK